jgi:hypothetical protein
MTDHPLEGKQSYPLGVVWGSCVPNAHPGPLIPLDASGQLADLAMNH